MVKYVAAMFTDRSKTLIKYQTDEGNVGHTKFDPNNQECKDILKIFPLIKLEENFINFERGEDKAKRAVEVYQNNQTVVDKILENWDLFNHTDTKFFRLEKLVNEWKMLEGEWEKLPRVTQVISEDALFKMSNKKFSKFVQFISKDIFLDLPEEKFSKLMQLIDNWKLFDHEWGKFQKVIKILKHYDKYEKFANEVDNYNIFKEKQDKIMHLIDNWDFVNNELKEKGDYIKPEIVEKIIEKEVSKDITLDEIEKIGNNKEQFFKMKLGIFEMPDVKNSKDRAWKAKMRKATSTFGLLGALNEGLEKMKNESSESQD